MKMRRKCGVARLCRLRYDDPGGDGACGEGDARTESMLLCQSSRGFNAGEPSYFDLSCSRVVVPCSRCIQAAAGICTGG